MIIPGVILLAALCATLVFLFLLWRRTRIAGFAVLAAQFVFMQFYGRFLTYLPNIFGNTPPIFRNVLLLTAVQVLGAVVVALAWWNIYARTAGSRPNNSFKPTPLRGAA
jgi:glucan phosphoethanolaminetransferase (alkaline phosphatase superfamily)